MHQPSGTAAKRSVATITAPLFEKKYLGTSPNSEVLPSGYLTVRHGESPSLIGKPSISMGHLYHGYVSHNQMVSFVGLLKYHGFDDFTYLRLYL